MPSPTMTNFRLLRTPFMFLPVAILDQMKNMKIRFFSSFTAIERNAKVRERRKRKKNEWRPDRSKALRATCFSFPITNCEKMKSIVCSRNFLGVFSSFYFFFKYFRKRKIQRHMRLLMDKSFFTRRLYLFDKRSNL